MICPNPYLDVNIHDTQHNTIKKIASELEILIKKCDKVSVLTKVSSLRNIILKRLIQRGHLLNIGVRKKIIS